MTHPNPQELFNEITAYIQQSRDLAERGAFLELAGLDQQVRDLCAQVLQLLPEEREKHAVQLQFLFDELAGLEHALIQKRDMVQATAQGLNTHQKANHAYVTTEAIDKKKPGSE